MELEQVSETIAEIFRVYGIRWEDYGTPDRLEVQTALAAMLDYTENNDERTQMELPAAKLKIVRDGDDIEVWVRIGDVHDVRTD